MHDPFHRAIGRQCFRTWEFIESYHKKRGSTIQSFSDTFVDMRLDGEGYKPDKDLENVWILPKKGLLTFTALFKLRESADDVVNGRGTDPLTTLKPVTDRMFHGFLKGVYSHIRLLPQQIQILDAISNFFLFTESQILQLIDDLVSTPRMRRNVLRKLFPSKTSGGLHIIRMYSDVIFGKKSEKSSNTDHVSSTVFSSENPTGHYVLSLANPFDRAIGQQLISIDRAEIEYAKQIDRAKNLGSFTNFRNGILDGKSFRYYPDWVLPHVGVWEFDYVTTHRFPLSIAQKDTIPNSSVNETTWKEFLECMASVFDSNKEGGFNIAMTALRRISGSIMVTSAQLDALLRCDPSLTQDMKTEMAVILFRRIVDYAEVKEQLCRARMGIEPALDASGLEMLERKLGKLNLMNPMKADNTSFTCDLATPEGRFTAQIVLSLLSREKGSRIINSRIGKTESAAQTCDPPKSWNTFVPHEGYWSVTYVTSEDGSGIDKALRKRLSVDICGFDPRTFN
jgi:hypothetical protein